MVQTQETHILRIIVHEDRSMTVVTQVLALDDDEVFARSPEHWRVINLTDDISGEDVRVKEIATVVRS